MMNHPLQTYDLSALVFVGCYKKAQVSASLIDSGHKNTQPELIAQKWQSQKGARGTFGSTYPVLKYAKTI